MSQLTIILRRQDGSVLVGVISLAIVMAMACVGYLQVSTSTANTVLAEQEDAKAFYAADAGLHLGAKWLRDSANAVTSYTSFTNTTNIVPGFSLNGYTTTIDIVKANGIILLRSTAISGSKLGYNKIITQEMSVTGMPIVSPAFDYAMVTDGQADITGNTNIRRESGAPWSIHANEALVISGNTTLGDAEVGDPQNYMRVSSSVSITANNKNQWINATAPVISDTHSRIKGASTIASVAEVTIPDIDLAPWRAAAAANGAVLTGPVSNPSPPAQGNILWIDGDVSINSGTYNCMIIATGNISISSHPTVTAPANGFALASQNGDITLSTQGTITGLVYTKTGCFRQTSGGAIRGQIISRGDIHKGGGSDIAISFSRTILTPPSSTGSSMALKNGTWNETNVAYGQ